MKKSINLFLALIGAYTLSAQCPEALEGEGKTSDVISAWNRCNLSGGESNKPVEAAQYIERAITHEKNKGKSKTWRYRGDIYLIMAQTQPDICPEALTIAKESYAKSAELDGGKGKMNPDISFGFDAVSRTAYGAAMEKYQASEYEAAAETFEVSASAKQEAATLDSLYMFASFNGGLSYENAGLTEQAVKKYEDCIAVGYEVKQCYFRIIAALQSADDLEGSLEWIQKGKAAYPDEPEFLIQETNYHLKAKDYAKAESNLTKAIENDPNNAMLHFVLGTALDQLDKPDEAVKAYKKAIEVDSEYLDAYHNLGACYVNSSVAMKETINELDYRKDQAEIARLEKEAESALKNAMPYLEKALELEPGNVQVMNSLKSIYFTFEQMDKYNDMKSRMEAAGN